MKKSKNRLKHKRNLYIKNEKKTNSKNKKLMADKILSYSPMLRVGIENYIDAYKNFWLMIMLGFLLRDFALISLPCCVLSLYFSIRMFQFVKYKTINNIVKVLAKDIAINGIYDYEKVETMINDFKINYGEDGIEYSELTTMIDSYREFVIKIEAVLKNINRVDEKDENKIISRKLNTSFIDDDYNINILSLKNNEIENRKLSYYDLDSKDTLSLVYRKEDGQTKKVNRAIEFFENSDNRIEENKTVVLKNNKENSNLTIYLYKKSSDLQKKVL